MIGERYAVAQGISAPRRRQPSRLGLPRRLAVAGRRRLGLARNGSVLVQLMLAMSLVAFAALLYLMQASQASVLEYNISELQAQQVQLNATNTDLHAQVTVLQSAQRIDSIATGRLHMTKPDISTAIWVTPVLPRIVSPRPLNADVVEAQRGSQPLAWIEHAVTMVKQSL